MSTKMQNTFRKLLLLLLSLVLVTSCSDTSFDSGDKGPETEIVFLLSKRDYKVGETIQFENTSRGTRQFKWDFGDGESSTEISPEHAYKNPGDYYPELKSAGKSRKAYRLKITVLDDGPGPEPEAIPELQMNLSASLLGVGEPLRYSCKYDRKTTYWDFSQDSRVQTNQGEIKFKEPGEYLVRLFWTDNSTLLDTATVLVFKASLSASKALTGDEIRFKAEAPFPVKWELEKGRIIDAPTGTHTYQDAGLQTLKLLSAGDGKVLRSYKITITKPFDSSTLDAMLVTLGNERASEQEKEDVYTELYSLCEKGKKTEVTGVESFVLEELVLRLIIESDPYSIVRIKTKIEINSAGAISSIELLQFDSVSK